MNLHDWIDELCDTLDVDMEVDEGLILDLTKVVADNVVKVAAPISAYILGLAAGRADASPEDVERLAARAQALAESWDRPRAGDATESDPAADAQADDAAAAAGDLAEPPGDEVDHGLIDEEYAER